VQVVSVAFLVLADGQDGADQKEFPVTQEYLVGLGNMVFPGIPESADIVVSQVGAVTRVNPVHLVYRAIQERLDTLGFLAGVVGRVSQVRVVSPGNLDSQGSPVTRDGLDSPDSRV
jgi:hypothetical protein